MAYIKKLRSRGASGVVTAYGEVLFMPGAPIHNWTNRFAARVRSFSAQEAPTNKRPRWGHYGKPLKSTMTASRPEFRKTARGARVYAAVGSTAPHAYYVDQGTGVYGGGGPYPAKVLPPWTRGSPTLYEASWRPGGPGTRRVAPVMIKGQRGQGFFEKGLKRGFQSMRMRSAQVPGGPKITAALAAFPRGLEFAGNTPNNGSFQASLAEWRTWRDTAWGNNGDLGRPKPVKAVKPPKAPKPPKQVKPTKPKKLTPAQKGEIARAIGRQLTAQGRQFRGLKVMDNGTWTALVKAANSSIFKPAQGRWRAP